MGHGGTNWGFWSGANGGGGSSFQPHETSVSKAWLHFLENSKRPSERHIPTNPPSLLYSTVVCCAR